MSLYLSFIGLLSFIRQQPIQYFFHVSEPSARADPRCIKLTVVSITYTKNNISEQPT